MAIRDVISLLPRELTVDDFFEQAVSAVERPHEEVVDLGSGFFK